MRYVIVTTQAELDAALKLKDVIPQLSLKSITSFRGVLRSRPMQCSHAFNKQAVRSIGHL